ncbi:hypothetical protein JCM8097_002230 [Rhodosporidiobolus ruineniae]
MPRTTQRASALRARQALAQPNESADDEEEYVSPDEGGDGDEDAEEEYARPTKKKPRTSTSGRAVPKVKGSLKDLLDLPLELVTLIFSHLDFETLFHLSRLNKRFWRFLRAKKALWVRARRNSGLPALLASCKTRSYANLLYGNCQGCGKTTSKVDFVLRIRACSLCTSKLIYRGVKGTNHKYSLAATYAVRSETGSKVEYALADLQAIRYMLVQRAEDERETLDKPLPQSLEEVDDAERIEGYTPRFAGFRTLIKLDKLDGFKTACDKLQKDRLTASCPVLLLLRGACSDTLSFQDAQRIQGWLSRREKAKEKEKQAIRTRRRAAIEERLLQRGWHEQYFEHTDFKNHDFLAIPKELTDRAWNGVQDEFDALLPDIRAVYDQKRIESEMLRRRNLLRYEHQELSKDEDGVRALGLYPLLAWPQFSKLHCVLEQFDMRTVEQTYDPDPSLVSLVGRITNEVSEQRQTLKSAIFDRLLTIFTAIDAGLAVPPAAPLAVGSSSAASTSSDAAAWIAPLKLMPEPSFGPLYSEEEKDLILDRAVSVVKCCSCMTSDTLTRLAHHCCTSHSTILSFLPQHYSVSNLVVMATLQVLKAAGKPVDTSAKSMSELVGYFSCTHPHCVGKLSCIAVPWHVLVEHLSFKHSQPPIDPTLVPSDFIVLEDRDTAAERLFQSHSAAFDLASRPGGPE